MRSTPSPSDRAGRRQTETPSRARPRDLPLALLAALVVGAVYLRTLLPDVGGYEDTPKFQYLGAVLGVAHRPGYPLYVLLSHLFSYIPIGTVAYRADLLSAVAGATAVAHVYLLARVLGFRRVAAWFGAVGLGFGSAFWTYSVLAEVYTLAALLVVAVLYWMVRWGESGRPAHLYAASAFFALGLGNHLSITMTGPAIALFLLVSRVRHTLTPRVVMTAGLIVASGLLQYVYVLIRTQQGVDWVEAGAATAPQMFGLLQPDTYQQFVMPFTWSNFATLYVPRLGYFARLEYGASGLALLALGVFWAFRQDWRQAALLAASAAGIIGLMLHIAGDMRGFLVSAWVIVSVLLAAGAQATLYAAGRLPGRIWATGVAIGLGCYPIWPLAANFAANDWSHRTDEARFLRAFVGSLPAPAALVDEGYELDSMLNYLKAVERNPVWAHVSKAPKDPAWVRPLFEKGVAVFAFSRGYGALAAQGLDFDHVVVTSQRLVDRLRELPHGSLVAIAAREAWLPADVIEALGLDATQTLAAPRAHQTLLATIGSPSSVAIMQDEQEAAAAAEASPVTPLLAHRIAVSASADGVKAWHGDQMLAAVAGGLVVVIADARNGSVEGYAPVPPEYRLARRGPFSVYRMTGLLPALEAGNLTWTDVTTVAADGWLSVTVNNFAAFEATTTAYAVADTPPSPALDARFASEPEPTIDVRVFDRQMDRDRADLDATIAAEGLTGEQLGPGRYVARIHQTVNDLGDWASWGLALGAVPSRVWLRGSTDRPERRRTVVSSVPVTRYLEHEPVRLINASAGYNWMFGRGWTRVEGDSTGEYRWTAEPEAYIVLPMAGGTDVDLSLSVFGRITTRNPNPSVEVALNGHDLGRCALEAGWQLCSWHAPSSAVRTGGNEVVVRSAVASAADEDPTSTDTRTRGVAVRQILLRR